ncbi:MAG: hypothetical protein LBT64_01510 [Puniceicoccales bacterium]|nr:hypothetical protein [Puniceicoccales bacterium]
MSEIGRVISETIGSVAGHREVRGTNGNVPHVDLDVRMPNVIPVGHHNVHLDVDDAGFSRNEMEMAIRASTLDGNAGYYEDIVPQATQNLPAENDDVRRKILEEDRKIISDTNKEYEESQAIDAAKANTKVSDECSASVHEIFGKVNLGTLPNLFESETQSIDIAEYADIIAAGTPISMDINFGEALPEDVALAIAMCKDAYAAVANAVQNGNVSLAFAKVKELAIAVRSAENEINLARSIGKNLGQMPKIVCDVDAAIVNVRESARKEFEKLSQEKRNLEMAVAKHERLLKFSPQSVTDDERGAVNVAHEKLENIARNLEIISKAIGLAAIMVSANSQLAKLTAPASAN